MILGRHVYGYNGDLLLATGKALDEYFIMRLSSLGFPGVYIEEKGYENIDPPEIVDGALRASTELLFSECLEKLANLNISDAVFEGSLEKSLAGHPELEKVLPVGEIRNKVNLVVQDILDQYTNQLPCLLLKTQGRYQVQHGMDTMLVAILLGINFRFLYRELRQLALAAFMHDVGKSVLLKQDEANVGPEHPRYKDHPLIGGLIMLHSGDDLYTECATIQQHHERQDGGGFPYGLKSEGKTPLQARGYHSGTIYRLAEIVSVADAYDILTAGTYKAPLTPEKALFEVINRSGTEFNPHIVKMLARIIQIFPVGSQVVIQKCSDPDLVRCRAIVSCVNAEKPHQCDLILFRDKSGKSIPPTPISLVGDEAARLELKL
jgi:hypothetical protein